MFLLAALATAALFPAGPTQAADARDVLMSRATRQGDLECRRGGSTTWLPIISNKWLAVGDLGRTGPGARAQLRITDTDVVLGVGPTTQFSVLDIVRGMGGGGGGRVNLSYGSLSPRLSHKGNPDRFQVVTPNAVLSAQGTGWTVHHVATDSTGALLGQEALPEGWQGETQPDHTRAAVTDGKVKATSSTGEIRMFERGNTMDIGPDGAIQLNPFPFPAAAGASASTTEAPAIERGTTGADQGAPPEVSGSTGPISTEGPTGAGGTTPPGSGRCTRPCGP